MKIFVRPILIQVTLVVSLFYSCGYSRKEILSYDKKNICNDFKDSSELVIEPLTFKFDREAFLIRQLDIIRASIDRGVVSYILYDECIDYSNISYYYLNSHTRLSLRFDIIQKMELEEIKKIIYLADSVKLMKLCKTKDDFMPYSDITTWELLNKRAKDCCK